MHQVVATAAEKRIDALYRLILGRMPDAPGMATWLAEYNSGVTLQQISADFLHSPEYVDKAVASYYEGYLGRAGSASEIAGWVSRLEFDLTQEQVAYDFLSSPEFSAEHPNVIDNNGQVDPSDFIQTLYGDVLGRAGDPSELAFWAGMLDSGTTRATVVSDFLHSPESQRVAIEGDYLVFLARQATPAELAYWQLKLDLGGGPLTLVDVASEFAGSPEFAARATYSIG